jgi:hypothetical protein
VPTDRPPVRRGARVPPRQGSPRDEGCTGTRSTRGRPREATPIPACERRPACSLAAPQTGTRAPLASADGSETVLPALATGGYDRPPAYVEGRSGRSFHLPRDEFRPTPVGGGRYGGPARAVSPEQPGARAKPRFPWSFCPCRATRCLPFVERPMSVPIRGGGAPGSRASPGAGGSFHAFTSGCAFLTERRVRDTSRSEPAAPHAPPSGATRD